MAEDHIAVRVPVAVVEKAFAEALGGPNWSVRSEIAQALRAAVLTQVLPAALDAVKELCGTEAFRNAVREHFLAGVAEGARAAGKGFV